MRRRWPASTAGLPTAARRALINGPAPSPARELIRSSSDVDAPLLSFLSAQLQLAPAVPQFLFYCPPVF